MIHSQLALSPVGVFQLALYRVCVCVISVHYEPVAALQTLVSRLMCVINLSLVCVCVCVCWCCGVSLLWCH